MTQSCGGTDVQGPPGSLVTQQGISRAWAGESLGTLLSSPAWEGVQLIELAPNKDQKVLGLKSDLHQLKENILCKEHALHC
jgi:hypothetical protein